MTRSTGISGLTRLGSPPSRAIAERIAARSTTPGTPVKSCMTTRAGLNGSSTWAGLAASQFASRRTSSSVTAKPSTWRSSASSSTLMENGSRLMWPMPASSSAARR